MRNVLELVARSDVMNAILQSGQKQIKLVGVNGVSKAVLTATLFDLQKKSMVILVAGRDELRDLRRSLSVLLPGVNIEEFYPADQVEFENSRQSKGLEILAARMLALRRIYTGEHSITLVTAEAFSQPLPLPEQLLLEDMILRVGQNYIMEKAIKDLSEEGYERNDIVEAPGQFCVRGGIIDVFPINSQFPVRIEWLDNEVDSIRAFSAETQRSMQELKEVLVTSLTIHERFEFKASILDYLPQEAFMLVDEATHVQAKLEELLHSGQLKEDKVYSWKYLEKILKKQENLLAFSAMSTDVFPFAYELEVKVRSLAPYHRQMELLREDLGKWLSDGKSPIICMAGEAKAKGMSKNFNSQGLKAKYWQEEDDFREATLLVTSCDLTAGFEFIGENWLVLTEQDIFGRMKRKAVAKKSKGSKIKYFSEIKVGDYVVHSVHGIGKYIGNRVVEAGGVKRDYLLIQYAGDDRLYVLVDQVDTLHKYIGADGHVPRLSRMGGSDWTRLRSRAKSAITEMAGELLRLQAERKLLSGHAFSPDTVWQKEFEETFPYEETPDQLQSIEEIKQDMERPYPMDRILCGDVGYGKTEVAIRAAFKAVMDSKQVAVLVPTTVLSQQHFQTFCDRLQPFGINVDMVSRFRTAKEQRETLKKSAMGKIDVLIGTHRLLQSDVTFKDLGLLIIDEEQRFGVGQKEKIKRWSKTVDVLVLSATPIPRTLHMGLVSARDMSIIETPPEDRLPVETFVAGYDDELVKQAILKELHRGGYIYYVYNRVKDIDLIADKISKLVPEARVKVAHGQMAEELLENAMIDFYNGEYDVLVCTSIIENGLDVPLANTIIIHGAENFGLSQLYQMRGRVGRSNRLAYAWFLYPKQRALSEVAEKRLQAIRDFTELGAGFRIAMRDLEIRGAGNILGPEQHGHIVSVGFETYCRLLEETMLELKNEPAAVQKLPEPIIEIQVDAYLPDDYINDPANKLDVYKRILQIDNKLDMEDMLDELIDRFGSPPQAVQQLLYIAMLKGFCRSLGIRAVNLNSFDVTIIFEDNASVRLDALLKMVSSKKYIATLKQGPPISIKTKRSKKQDALKWFEELLEFLLEE